MNWVEPDLFLLLKNFLTKADEIGADDSGYNQGQQEDTGEGTGKWDERTYS